MRRFVIPLVFVALLVMAAVLPVAASGGDPSTKPSDHSCPYSG